MAIRNRAEEVIGGVGALSITGTDAVASTTGYHYFAIQVIADMVVSAQGNVDGASNPDLTDFTSIPAGTILYGRFNSITLTSGEAVGYLAPTIA